MSQILTDLQRRQIHDFALNARALLTREAWELLEGVYGLYPNGTMDPPHKLPQVQADPETEALYHRLKRFLDDEVQAGLPRPEAIEKLVKEIAFTHLNRLVALRMMEVRGLIRGTVNKGLDSNGFKFYLADPEHLAVYTLYQQGQSDEAYRHFLLWQCGQVARELKTLFDPDALPGRIFPRPQKLHELLSLLNAPNLADVWQAEETIGWIYQYFNEQEKADVFDRLYNQKQKIRRQDIPAATQLFTPNWIVRFLVQNTLGRLWVQMHPDTQLLQSELLDYLAPLKGEVPVEPPRPLRDITLLDPACGTMHFGLVAFDLFAAMYREELARAGEPGWPQTSSVANEADIPAAIIANNLFGIDIDLRAVQLSALTLYLKAKALNKNARITDSNLACADVLPLNGARLGTFIKEMRFTRPVYERLIRALWARLQDVNQLGSLLRLEKELGELIEAERARYQELPLFAGMPGEFEREAAADDFWNIIFVQVIQGLDEFARQQARAGVDQTFFTSEATKGLRLLNVMLACYDVVVTNPPYSGKSNLSDTVATYLDYSYKDAKGDLYAAFIQRCAEFTCPAGRLGMITQQSFMFLSSYEQLRANLRAEFAIETMTHTGSRAFADIKGEKVNTTAFVLRKTENLTQRENSVGTYIRLVNAPEGDGKRRIFERALQNESYTYHVAQNRFDAIPGQPWTYWIGEQIRVLFENLPRLNEVSEPRQGLITADVFRFVRYWWEVGISQIKLFATSRTEATNSQMRWFPYVKGGSYQKWYGNQEYVVNWYRDGTEIRNFYRADGDLASRPQNLDYYFVEGVTWSKVTSNDLSTRYMPQGYIISDAGMGLFPETFSSEFTVGLTNSSFFNGLLRLISPSINFQAGDLAKVPVPIVTDETKVNKIVAKSVHLSLRVEMLKESTVDFRFVTTLNKATLDNKITSKLQFDLDHEIIKLYKIDQQAVEDISLVQSLDEQHLIENAVKIPDSLEAERNFAQHWISYAIGIILSRFQVGNSYQYGSAVYTREDFAIGSLPVPNEDEFDELVGSPEQFAYVDVDGGRHIFSVATEQALRDLAVPDGITVLDEGHPRDLSTLVEKALRLMLGDSAAQEVIQAATGDRSSNSTATLRAFLERDFFTKWHFKWYRSRPVYWPLQSAKRSYGFVLFHEKIDRQTLYVLQRDYLDARLNGLRLHLADLRDQQASQSGKALKLLERQIDKVSQELEEISTFARTIERLVHEGYEPEPNWIDDGVILRLAPLWELIPIWKNEPKKYWEQLQAGQYDWSHIAQRYWPQRVREACRRNKSFAIAHGHEAWYEGNQS